MIKEISHIQKKYCSQAIIIAIAMSLLLILFGEKAVGKGLLLGTLFSIVNFIIMGQMVTLKLVDSRSKASAFAFVSIFFRFGILAIPLIISMKSNAIHFIGVAAGLFMIQLTILFNHIILDRITADKKT